MTTKLSCVLADFVTGLYHATVNSQSVEYILILYIFFTTDRHTDIQTDRQ